MRMTQVKGPTHDGSLPPDWALVRPKTLIQHIWDLVGAPLRMLLLPDAASERFHLTSLRSERYAAVLPQLSGRVLDVGAGDNALIRAYQSRLASSHRLDDAARQSIGVDVVDWGGGAMLIQSS